MPNGGPVAFFTGWLGTQDHADKLRGFESSLSGAGPRFPVASIVEAHDDEAAGFRQAVSLLRAREDLAGIYVSTVNSLPVLEAVKLEGRAEVGDSRDDRPLSRTRAVDSPGDGRGDRVPASVTQGRMAVQALYHYLLDGTTPPHRVKVAPHVVMRSNLDLILERLRPDTDDLHPAE